MNNYEYIDAQGKSQVIQAQTPELAIKNAPNIAPTSGVMLVRNTPAGATQPQVPVSSNTPLIQRDAQQAKNSAIQNMGGQSDYPFNNNALDYFSNEMKGMSNMVAGQMAMLDSAFSKQLAATNSVYANAFRELEEKTALSHKSWEATAAKLNPYSDQTTSTNIRQHHDKIIDRSNRAAAELTAKAEQAQAALAMGQAESYIAMQKEMTDYSRGVQRDLLNYQLNMWNDIRDAEYKQTQTLMNYVELFQADLTNISETPEEIEAMTPQQIMNHPITRYAIEAGVNNVEDLRYWMKQASESIQSGVISESQKADLDKRAQEALINQRNASASASFALANQRNQDGDEGTKNMNDIKAWSRRLISGEDSISSVPTNLKTDVVIMQEAYQDLESDILNSFESDPDTDPKALIATLKSFYPEFSESEIEAMVRKLYQPELEKEISDGFFKSIFNFLK